MAAASTSAVLRRIISESDAMEVVASSSSSSPESTPLSHRDTNNPAFPSPMRSTNVSASVVDNSLLEDDPGISLSIPFPNEPNDFSGQSTSLFPQLMSPLHCTSQEIGFSSLTAAGAALFTTRSMQRQDEDQRGDQVEDDCVKSERTEQSCHSHDNIVSSDNPLLLANLGSRSRTLQSLPSNVSMQSWGQMAVIDATPQVNGT